MRRDEERLTSDPGPRRGALSGAPWPRFAPRPASTPAEAAPQILLAETHDVVARALEMRLLNLGSQPSLTLATSATQVAVGLGTVDIAILDATVPWLDVVPLCEEARSRESECFILVIGLPPSEVDRVVLLDAGVDDALSRPCGTAELFARVRALVRRWRRWVDPRVAGIAGVLPDLELLPARRAVFATGVQVGLSRREFAVLEALLDRPGQVVSREGLRGRVWGTTAVSGKAVDVVVARLREKLTKAEAEVRITTVRGVGFRLESVPCLAPVRAG